LLITREEAKDLKCKEDFRDKLEQMTANSVGVQEWREAPSQSPPREQGNSFL
jgi:hypothetical protein